MVEQFSPEEVARRLHESPSSLLLLDVREPDERAVATIAPSLHIPMGQVPARLREVPKDTEVIVYCHTGVRSMMVAGFLEHQGYAHVGNLDGGIEAWSKRVDPSVPRY